MTDQGLTTAEQLDALAAEFALGVHDSARHLALSERYERDTAFAERVDAWRRDFSAMDDDFEPEAPPTELKASLDAALDEVSWQADRATTIRLKPRAPFWSRLSLWRGLTLASVLAFAGALGFSIYQQRTSVEVGSDLVAVLNLPAGDTYEPAQVLAVIPASYPEQSVKIDFIAGADPDAFDYQLWAIGEEGVPQSLGLLDNMDHKATNPAILSNSILAVSLEPVGGSLLAGPSGPVLTTATLQEI